tara:strand:- start:37 stop:240 length:204 start_codon:yes stop_codon:yes gene_type:complete
MVKYSKEHIRQMKYPGHNQFGYRGEQKKNTCKRYPDCDGYNLWETLGRTYRVPCEYCNKEAKHEERV